MITISEAVSTIVLRSPFLSEGMSRGLLNVSGVAREITPEVERLTGKEVTTGSIVMALKRLPLGKDEAGSAVLFDAAPDMILRSNLFEVTYETSPTLFRGQRRLMEIMGDSQNFLTITTGIRETTVIASEALRPVVVTMFADENVVAEIEGLSSVTIRLPASIPVTPGSYAQILKLLAFDGINIVEVVSTYQELTILLRGDEVDRALAVLKRAFA